MPNLRAFVCLLVLCGWLWATVFAQHESPRAASFKAPFNELTFMGLHRSESPDTPRLHRQHPPAPPQPPPTQRVYWFRIVGRRRRGSIAAELRGVLYNARRTPHPLRPPAANIHITVEQAFDIGPNLLWQLLTWLPGDARDNTLVPMAEGGEPLTHAERIHLFNTYRAELSAPERALLWRYLWHYRIPRAPARPESPGRVGSWHWDTVPGRPNLLRAAPEGPPSVLWQARPPGMRRLYIGGYRDQPQHAVHRGPSSQETIPGGEMLGQQPPVVLSQVPTRQGGASQGSAVSGGVPGLMPQRRRRGPTWEGGTTDGRRRPSGRRRQQSQEETSEQQSRGT